MAPPHCQPPARRLVTESGFWLCILPTLGFFWLTGSAGGNQHIYLLRSFVLPIVLVAGVFWVILANSARQKIRLGIALGCALICFGCGWGFLAMRLRTFVSLPWLNTLSTRLKHGEKVVFPQLAGLFIFRSCSKLEGEFQLHYDDGFNGSGALALGSAPTPDAHEFYYKLFEPWSLRVTDY